MHLRATRFRLQKALQRRQVVSLKEVCEGLTGNALGRVGHQLRKALVAIQNRSICRQRERAFAHLLDHQAIRLVGGAQRVDLFAFRSADDERFDVSFADGVDRVFGFLQPSAQFLHGRRGSAPSLLLNH